MNQRGRSNTGHCKKQEPRKMTAHTATSFKSARDNDKQKNIEILKAGSFIALKSFVKI